MQMTREEILIQTLAEVSSKPRPEVKEMFARFRKANPGGKWD